MVLKVLKLHMQVDSFTKNLCGPSVLPDLSASGTNSMRLEEAEMDHEKLLLIVSSQKKKKKTGGQSGLKKRPKTRKTCQTREKLGTRHKSGFAPGLVFKIMLITVKLPHINMDYLIMKITN